MARIVRSTAARTESATPLSSGLAAGSSRCRESPVIASAEHNPRPCPATSAPRPRSPPTRCSPATPGSPWRSPSGLLAAPLMSNHNRGLWGYSGSDADGSELTVQATGIGGPSAAAVLSELAGHGARRASGSAAVRRWSTSSSSGTRCAPPAASEPTASASRSGHGARPPTRRSIAPWPRPRRARGARTVAGHDSGERRGDRGARRLARGRRVSRRPAYRGAAGARRAARNRGRSGARGRRVRRRLAGGRGAGRGAPARARRRRGPGAGCARGADRVGSAP